MPNIMTSFNKVDKSGDTMTGDLNLGLNKLILHDGSHGGIIKGSSIVADEVLIRNMADDSEGKVFGSEGLFQTRVITGKAGILIGDGTDGGRIIAKATEGQKLFAYEYGAEVAIPIEQVTTGGMQMTTGTYVGNATDNREIDIGIDLNSMSKVFIIIKRKTVSTATAVFKGEMGQGDESEYTGSQASSSNLIQSLTSNGFVIGTGDGVNASGVTHIYTVLWQP